MKTLRDISGCEYMKCQYAGRSDSNEPVCRYESSACVYREEAEEVTRLRTENERLKADLAAEREQAKREEHPQGEGEINDMLPPWNPPAKPFNLYHPIPRKELETELAAHKEIVESLHQEIERQDKELTAEKARWKPVEEAVEEVEHRLFYKAHNIMVAVKKAMEGK